MIKFLLHLILLPFICFYFVTNPNEFKRNNTPNISQAHRLSEENSDGDSDEQNFYKTYVYFGKAAPVANITSVKAHFFSTDGKSEEVIGEEVSSIGLSSSSYLASRLYCFKTPLYSEMSYYEIIHNNTKSQWSITNLYKLSGLVFCYDTSNYSIIESTTGWNPINYTMVDFADYFISRIDVESSSLFNGFMSYRYIDEYLLSHVTDYNTEQSKRIVWTDLFGNGEVSLFDQLLLLREKYNSNKEEEQITWLPYVIGICVLVISLIAVVRFSGVRFKHEKRKVQQF